MTIWVWSNRPSLGASILSKADGFGRMVLGKKFKKGDVVVNWGSTKEPPVGDIILNKSHNIKIAVNKLTTFQVLSGAGVSMCPWTANQEVAQEWLEAGSTIIVRKNLTGSGGDGIIVVEKGNELQEAPLYTKYIFKAKEFRVHATQEGVFDTQQKVRDPAREPTSWKIRSYDNGFIFQRKNIEPNKDRDALAVRAIKALGLDFGGLDIIEDKNGVFYVLEVNTAPGIEGTSIQRYTEALRGLAEAALGRAANA